MSELEDSTLFGCGKSSGSYRDRTGSVTSFIHTPAVARHFRRCLQHTLPIASKPKLSTSNFTRHNRANPALHCHVHGHNRDLGQRIWLHERNPGFPHFPLHPSSSGKMVGDSTDALLQGIVVFVIGLAIGIPH